MDGRTLVHTKVQSGQDSGAIDYVMEKTPKGWRAVDVITEGVSLVETYQTQVNKIIAKKNFAAGIEALEKKRKALEAAEEKPATANAAKGENRIMDRYLAYGSAL